ncbi:MAG TPA: lipopolysaccharide assembly protein LapA domain-containing protein [Actinomycetota bacterium]|nr:lipopolysaccharide assembly protein LapA domain-containing protein [Actinomycetota bacterium]
MTEGRRSSVGPQDGEPRVARDGEPGAVERPRAPDEAARRAGGPSRTVERTRASALWTALAVGLLALVVILIFVTQNSSSVRIHFLMAEISMSLGVALLVAALLGALLMLAIGTVRILQLRRLARRPQLAERRRR